MVVGGLVVAGRVEVEVAATVVGAAVVGGMVVGGLVIAGRVEVVVPATVVGAAVVGGMVVDCAKYQCR
jgi:hypothetical protein